MNPVHQRALRGPLLAAVPVLLALTATAPMAQEANTLREANAAAVEPAPYRPTFVKLRTGAEVPVWDGLKQSVGSVYDLVIEHASGKVVAAVLDLGAADARELKLVPYKRLEWAADRQRFVLPLDRKALEALPPFRVEDLQVIDSSGGLPAKNTAEVKTRDVRAGSKRRVRNLLAAELRGVRVSAEQTAFGTIAYLILEPEHGLVNFVSVRPNARLTTGPDPYVVPWTAMHRKKEGDFTLKLNLAALRAAPVLNRDRLEGLRDDVFRTGAFRFYGLEPYRFEALHDTKTLTAR